ncbi:MAG: TetR/AcrR family transcriptional regulator [Bacteroidota bacterium]
MPRTKNFNKDAVLEQAMELFWKKGYYATSVQDLVDHLGINRGSLYNTYGGKKELFDEAFHHYRTVNTEVVKKFLYKQKNVREGLRALFELAIKQSQKDPDHKGCFVVNSTIEFIPNDAVTIEVLNQNKVQFEKIFYNYLLSGVEKGEISADKDLSTIATLLFTYYNGLKVVTKLEFNSQRFLNSVKSLLSILD